MRRHRHALVAIAAGLVFGAAAAGIGAPAPARAASVVFSGDPVDGGGRPYEILPGQPLVTAGADARLGTADDVVTPGVIGDIDVVVRLGSVPGSGPIPAPAPSRHAVATATAGLRGTGVAIPFAV